MDLILTQERRWVMYPLYISVDIEATGPPARQFSMISVGACVIGKVKESFYREIKPVNTAFLEASMRIACQGMHCLIPYQEKDQFNPNHRDFNPGIAMEAIKDLAMEPSQAMNEFWVWLKIHGFDRKIYFVSDTASLDWSYVHYYMSLFCTDNPFENSRFNLSELNCDRYMGMKINTSMVDVPDNRNPPHNALEDAILNAKIIEQILRHNRHVWKELRKLAA